MRVDQRRFRNIATALLFILPGFLLFFTFVIGPMIYSFRLSLYDWNIVKPEKSEWIGLENYARALGDPIFRRAVLNTLVYTLITVPGQIIIGLIIAVLLNQDIRGKSFFRVAWKGFNPSE